METVASCSIFWCRVFAGPVCSDNTSLAKHGADADGSSYFSGCTSLAMWLYELNQCLDIFKLALHQLDVL